MSQTTCPSCGFGFDDHRPIGAEGLRGRLLFGPERLISKPRVDSTAFDTCPSCGNRFVSGELATFRAFARLKLRSMGIIYGLMGLLIAALGTTVWVLGR